MQNGSMPVQPNSGPTQEDIVIQIWLAEPEPVKRIFNYDFDKYYNSNEWVSKLRNEEVPQAPEAPKQPLPPTPPVNANAIQDMRVNANVMQTGLTQTEQALLSPEEQVMRLRQRGLSR